MTEAAVDPSAAPPAAPRPRLRWWREILYILAFYGIYSLVRNQFGSQGTGDTVDPSVAFEHARSIIRLEERLHLYFEPDLQRWYLDLPAMGFIRIWNIFYGTLHFVVTAGAMVWLYRKDPLRYPRWRNTLAATTGIALVGFASYSLMPPRLLDDPGEYGACRLYAPAAAAAAPEDEHEVPGCDRYGYVDTLEVHGGWLSFDDEGAKAVTNQYAAMPSMHVGWSVWCVLALLPAMRRRWQRVLVALYPGVTMFTILVTANHYWIDAVGGLAALGVGAVLARWFTEWAARRWPGPAAEASAPA